MSTTANQPKCKCGDRSASACPGEWEPGCDLGNNPAHVRVHHETPEDRASLDAALGLWVCPWDICNTKQAQECRAAIGNTKRTRGCGSYFPPGTTLEQAKQMIAPRATEATAPAPPTTNQG